MLPNKAVLLTKSIWFKMGGLFFSIFLILLTSQLVNVEGRKFTDEHIWVTLSIDFSKRVLTGELDKTNVATKPGVTVNWVSGAATTLSRYLRNEKDLFSKYPSKADYLYNRYTFSFLIALISSLIFLILINFLSWGESTLITLLIGLHPLLTDKMGAVWTDIFLSLFTVISISSFLAFIKRKQNKFLVLSGIGLGLALATKTVAFLLIPSLVISVLLSFPQRDRLKIKLKQILFVFLIGIVVLFLLEPYLWTNPLGFLIRPVEIVKDAAYTSDTKQLANFSLFFYPFSFVFVDIFLAVLSTFVFILLLPKLITDRFHLKHLVFPIIFFVISFALVIVMSQIKYSTGNINQNIASVRYLMPAILVLILFFVPACFYLSKTRFKTFVVFPYVVLLFYIYEFLFKVFPI